MEKKKLTVVDADSIINIVAANYIIKGDTLKLLSVTEPTEESVQEAYARTFVVKDVLARVDSFVTSILTVTKADFYQLFIADHTAEKTDMFRYKLAVSKPYKGNRPKSPAYLTYWKPIIANHLINRWLASPQRWIEADDAAAISIEKYRDTYDCTLCSPDKDLRQVKGKLYNYAKLTHHFYTEDEAVSFLFAQCMIGDTQTDNIPGLPKVGKKSPLLKFPNCHTFEQYKAYTIKCFADKGYSEEYYNEQMGLIFMLRKDAHGSTVEQDPIHVANLAAPASAVLKQASNVIPPML